MRFDEPKRLMRARALRSAAPSAAADDAPGVTAAGAASPAVPPASVQPATASNADGGAVGARRNSSEIDGEIAMSSDGLSARPAHGERTDGAASVKTPSPSETNVSNAPTTHASPANPNSMASCKEGAASETQAGDAASTENLHRQLSAAPPPGERGRSKSDP